MKRYIKIIAFILLALMLIFVNTKCLAVTPSDFKPVDVDGAKKITDAGSTIVSYIVYIGTFISLGIMIVIGIKYMLGSAEQRADYKKSMIPYFVGAILLFGASSVTKLIYSFSQSAASSK